MNPEKARIGRAAIPPLEAYCCCAIYSAALISSHKTKTRKIDMKKLFLFLALASFVGLHAQKSFIDVRNLNEVGLLPESAILYSLPQNKIHIRVWATKKVMMVGPFHEYAAKYLGDEKVNQADKTAWEISRVEYYTTAQPDTSHIYAIRATGDNLANHVSLTNEGYLRAINDNNPLQVNNTSLHTAWKGQEDEQEKRSSFALVSTRQSMVEKIDTVYRKERNDSMEVQVPIVRRQLVEKTTEQKAAEIAKLLFTLRDDRNALLIGESDGKALPDGAALQLMLKEMDQLERHYLELFIGSSWQEQHSFDFEYLPHPMRPFERKVLFKFAPQNGVLSAEDTRGIPVLLAIQKENVQEQHKQFLEKQRRMRKKPLPEQGHAYRLPGEAKVSLQRNKETLFEETLKIAQFGIINHLPVELLRRKDYTVQFNPLYGSLIGVSFAK